MPEVAVVSADLDVCMGYANCVIAAEDYFDEADGMVRVLHRDVAAADVVRVQAAVDVCPVRALSLQR